MELSTYWRGTVSTAVIQKRWMTGQGDGDALMDPVDVGRLVLVVAILAGFVPVAVAHWRQGIKWMFSAYGMLAVGGVILLVQVVFTLPYYELMIAVSVAASSILFFLSAYLSGNTIKELEERVQEQRIDLGGEGV